MKRRKISKREPPEIDFPSLMSDRIERLTEEAQNMMSEIEQFHPQQNQAGQPNDLHGGEKMVQEKLQNFDTVISELRGRISEKFTNILINSSKCESIEFPNVIDVVAIILSFIPPFEILALRHTCTLFNSAFQNPLTVQYFYFTNFNKFRLSGAEQSGFNSRVYFTKFLHYRSNNLKVIEICLTKRVFNMTFDNFFRDWRRWVRVNDLVFRNCRLLKISTDLFLLFKSAEEVLKIFPRLTRIHFTSCSANYKSSQNKYLFRNMNFRELEEVKYMFMNFSGFVQSANNHRSTLLNFLGLGALGMMLDDDSHTFSQDGLKPTTQLNSREKKPEDNVTGKEFVLSEWRNLRCYHGPFYTDAEIVKLLNQNEKMEDLKVMHVFQKEKLIDVQTKSYPSVEAFSTMIADTPVYSFLSFRNATNLRVNKLDVSSFTVKKFKLKRLEKLEITGDQLIDKKSAEKLKKLTELRCKIKFMDCLPKRVRKKLTTMSLDYVNVREKELKEVKLSYFRNLHEIEFVHYPGKVKNIDFSGKKLKVVKFKSYFNPEFEFPKNTNVEHLVLSMRSLNRKNLLVNIENQSLKSLKIEGKNPQKMHLSCNYLKELDLSGCRGAIDEFSVHCKSMELFNFSSTMDNLVAKRCKYVELYLPFCKKIHIDSTIFLTKMTKQDYLYSKVSKLSLGDKRKLCDIISTELFTRNALGKFSNLRFFVMNHVRILEADRYEMDKFVHPKIGKLVIIDCQNVYMKIFVNFMPKITRLRIQSALKGGFTNPPWKLKELVLVSDSPLKALVKSFFKRSSESLEFLSLRGKKIGGLGNVSLKKLHTLILNSNISIEGAKFSSTLKNFRLNIAVVSVDNERRVIQNMIDSFEKFFKKFNSNDDVELDNVDLRFNKRTWQYSYFHIRDNKKKLMDDSLRKILKRIGKMKISSNVRVCFSESNMTNFSEDVIVKLIQRYKERGISISIVVNP